MCLALPIKGAQHLAQLMLCWQAATNKGTTLIFVEVDTLISSTAGGGAGSFKR